MKPLLKSTVSALALMAAIGLGGAMDAQASESIVRDPAEVPAPIASTEPATGKIELQTGTVSWSGERHMRVKVEGLPQPVCNLGKGVNGGWAGWYKQDGKRGVIRTIIKLAIGKVFP